MLPKKLHDASSITSLCCYGDSVHEIWTRATIVTLIHNDFAYVLQLLLHKINLYSYSYSTYLIFHLSTILRCYILFTREIITYLVILESAITSEAHIIISTSFIRCCTKCNITLFAFDCVCNNVYIFCFTDFFYLFLQSSLIVKKMTDIS